MIDVVAAERLLEAWERGFDADEAERWIAEQPAYQNITYPLALPPLVIDGSRLQELRTSVEAYLVLLEKLVALYRQHRQIQALFHLDIAAAELIDAEAEPARAIRVCRLDGYVDANSGRYQLLEHNADCPAGTLFTPRLNTIVRRLLGDHAPRPRLAMDSADPFTALLLSVGRAVASGRAPAFAVLQIRGRANRESHEVAAVLRMAGCTCEVVDPRDLALSSDGWIAAGCRLDVIWNKINTAAWAVLVQEAPELVGWFATAMQHSAAPCHINSFAARYVAESKTALAVLRSDVLARWLTAEEQELIARLVPWTERLVRDGEVAYEGVRWPLGRLVLERRPELVLKQCYDIRGDGVTIGRSTADDAWAAAIEAAWDTGAVLQRYVPPTRYPVRQLGDLTTQLLFTSLDSFVFDGQLVGFGSKASARDKVNLFQGGTKLAVVVGDGP